MVGSLLPKLNINSKFFYFAGGWMLGIDRINIFSDLRALGATAGEIFYLTFLTVLFAFFEGVGIALLLPVLEYAEQGQFSTSAFPGNIFSRLIETFHFESGRATLFLLLGMAFAALTVRTLVQYARDIKAAGLKYKVAGTIRRRAVKAFTDADMTFLGAHDRGTFFNALTLEADRSAEAMASRIVFFNATVLLFFYLVLMFFLAPLLALYTLPIFFVVGYVFRCQGRLTNSLSASVVDENRRFAGQISEGLNNIIRIKMRAHEGNATKIMSRSIERIMSALFGIERLRILVEIGIYPVLVLAVFVILYVAVIHLHMSLAGLGVFMFVMTRLVPQLTLMNSMWAHMHGCLASFHELDKLLKEANSKREIASGETRFIHLKRGVEFENVSFLYPQTGSTFALSKVNFSVLRGTMLAIVGHSGAGKTTIVNLLTGFYLPQSGAIRVDDLTLSDYDRFSWRRKIAYVPQEPLIFNDTIRNNINFGLLKPHPDEHLNVFLEQAYCQDFIEKLELGLDFEVGEQGCRLSQGQRQRLAIAIALAIEPEILIMDEPTSALDAESERGIRMTLDALKGKLTIIVIAHRFSTIAQADQVLLMDNGKLVASGSHEHLSTFSPLYRKLFATQILA